MCELCRAIYGDPDYADKMYDEWEKINNEESNDMEEE